VEVEFVVAPEWTDELALKYYIFFDGRLLTGEVAHANISAGLNPIVHVRLAVGASAQVAARFIG